MTAAYLRGPAAALFVAVFGVYAYFYQAGGWNQNTRFDLARAMVERHTLTIDAFHENTGDKAKRGEHYYCDKAPGITFLMLPAYAAAYALDGAHREMDHYQTAASYACTLLAVALPSAAAVALFFRLALALGLGAASAAALALAWALGTLALPYSTLLYGHQTAAAFVFMGFALVSLERERNDWRASRLLAAGLALGAAILVEYPAALGAGVVLLYAALALRSPRALLWLLLGMVPPLAMLAGYHALAFGGPLTLPYSFSTQKPRHSGVFMGLVPPTREVLWHLTFGEYRGLFFGSPWLLLALPGAITWMARARTRLEGLAMAVVPLLYFTLAASLIDWHGGWGMGGPRHMVQALPFLALAAGGVLAARGSRARPLLLALAGGGVAWSIFLMTVGTAVKPEVPRAIEAPFQEYLFPAFFAGDLALNTQSIDMVTGRGREVRFAWNLGQLAGLQGLTSLLPLAGWLALTGVWLLRALRRPAGN